MKKKITVLALILCIIATILLLFVACKENEQTPPQINAVEFAVSGQGISWADVNNTIGYKYKVNDGDWNSLTKEQRSVNFPTAVGNYTVSVVAIGEHSESSATSISFVVTTKVSSANVVDNSIVFDGQNIICNVNDGEYYSPLNNVVDFSNGTIGQTYTVGYYSAGLNEWDGTTNTYYVDEQIKTVSVTVKATLTAPVVFYDSTTSRLVWTTDDNAQTYTVDIDGTKVTKQKADNFVEIPTTVGKHTITVFANQTAQYLKSQSYTYQMETVFNAIPNVSYNQQDNLVSWDSKFIGTMATSNNGTAFELMQDNHIALSQGLVIRQNAYFDSEQKVLYLQSLPLTVVTRSAPQITFTKEGVISWNASDVDEQRCYYLSVYQDVEDMYFVNANTVDVSNKAIGNWTAKVYCASYTHIGNDSATLYLPSDSSSIDFEVLQPTVLTADYNANKVYWEISPDTAYQYKVDNGNWQVAPTNGFVSCQAGSTYYVQAVGSEQAGNYKVNGVIASKTIKENYYPITVHNPSVDFGKLLSVPTGLICTENTINDLQTSIGSFAGVNALKLTYHNRNNAGFGAVGIAFDDIALNKGEVVRITYAIVKGTSAGGCLDLNTSHSDSAWLVNTETSTEFTTYTYTASKAVTLSKLMFGFYADDIDVEIYVSKVEVLRANDMLPIGEQGVDFATAEKVIYGNISQEYPYTITDLEYNLEEYQGQQALKLSYHVINDGVFGGVGLAFDDIVLHKGDTVSLKYAIVQGAAGSIALNGSQTTGTWLKDVSPSADFATYSYTATKDVTLKSLMFSSYTSKVDMVIYIAKAEILRSQTITETGVDFTTLSDVPFGYVIKANQITNLEYGIENYNGTNALKLSYSSKNSAGSYGGVGLAFDDIALKKGDIVKLTYVLTSGINGAIDLNGTHDDNTRWLADISVGTAFTTMTYTASADKTLSSLMFCFYGNADNVVIYVTKVEILHVYKLDENGIDFANLSEIPFGSCYTENGLNASVTLEQKDGGTTNVAHFHAQGRSGGNAHYGVQFNNVQLDVGDKIQVVMKLDFTGNNGAMRVNKNGWITVSTGEWITFTYTATEQKTVTSVEFEDCSSNVATVDFYIESVTIVRAQ